MVNFNARVYFLAHKLIQLYNQSPTFREKFIASLDKPRVTFYGIPLKQVVKVIAQTSSRYAIYTRAHLNKDSINDLFTRFYTDPNGYGKLLQTSAQNEHLLTDDEKQIKEQLGRLSLYPESKEKSNAFEKLFEAEGGEKKNKKDEKDEDQKTKKETEKQPLKIPATLKDIFSKGEILTKKATSKITSPRLLSAVLGPIGEATKAMLGVGGETILRGGYKAADTASRGILGLSNLKAPLFPGSGLFRNPVVWIIAAIVGIFLSLIPGGILESSALLPPYEKLSSTIIQTDQISLTKSGPTSVPNGSTIEYRLSLENRGVVVADIEVLDSIPFQTEFESVSDGGVKEGNFVKWRFQLAPRTTKFFSFTVKPTTNDIIVTNTAEAKIIKPQFGGGGGNISSCTFTRAGKQAPYKSSTLMSWVAQATAREGIPTAVLASILRHETPTFTTYSDENHDGIKNDYYYIVSQVNQGRNKDTNATGIAQISIGLTLTDRGPVDHCPGLFSSGILKTAADNVGKKLRDQSYYCISDYTERIKRFCNTNRTAKNQDYYTPDKANDEYLDLCKITDNLAVAAALLRTKIGSGSFNNENDLRAAINGYYGGCAYPGGDYCAEVIDDNKRCTTTAVAAQPGSTVYCPIPNGKTTCGPSKPTNTSYPSCDKGHCAGNYNPQAPQCVKYPGTSYAIDVPAQPNQDIYLPYLTDPASGNSIPLTCEYKGEVVGDSGYQNITQFNCANDITGELVWIQFHHVLPGSGPQRGTYKSGQSVGGKIDPDRVNGFPHVHVQIGINGGCGSDSSGCVAADRYLQCK